MWRRMLAFELCWDCQLCFILDISKNNVRNKNINNNTVVLISMCSSYSWRDSANQLSVLRSTALSIYSGAYRKIIAISAVFNFYYGLNIKLYVLNSTNNLHVFRKYEFNFKLNLSHSNYPLTIHVSCWTWNAYLVNKYE